ncbi:hypothetical protein BSKO_00476 [Bryopsis sp. KO-2023]|nr:hypothetical protein BSKO_00476 [Bryopsis sp. KO-2023]
MSSAVWSLTAEQRQEVVSRVCSNLCALAFANKGSSWKLMDAMKVAKTIETKAYTAAEVQAVTTTGARPKTDVTKAYARKLSELIMEVVQGNIDVNANGAASTSPDNENVVDLSGSREFLTKPAAEEMLSGLLTTGAKVEKVVFSMKSFSTDAAEVAAKGLENVKATLKQADISDTIAGRPESEALKVLQKLSVALSKSNLMDLDLSDNALGEKGVRACEDVLKSQMGLRNLALRNVGCSDKACEAVDELLVTSDLRGLFLYNNMSGSKGAEAIARILSRAPQLERFQMASSRVEAEGGNALAKSLCSGSCLVELDLSDNTMTEEVAEGLAAVIKHQSSLRVLNLNDTSLGDEGVAVIATALAQAAPQLETLELALNEVTPESAKKIAAALVNKKSLKKLNLRENELEDRGALLIARGLEGNETLEELDLVMNMIGRAGSVGVAKALGNKPNFKRLDLDDNQISEAGIEEMKGVLEKNFGQSDALGSLEENDPDAEEDDDDEIKELTRSIATISLDAE